MSLGHSKWDLQRFYNLQEGNLKLLIVCKNIEVVNTLEVLLNLSKKDVINTYSEGCNLGIVLSDCSKEFEEYFRKILFSGNFGKLHVELWAHGEKLIIRR